MIVRYNGPEEDENEESEVFSIEESTSIIMD